LSLTALDIGVLGLRALSFIAIFQAAGIFIFLKIFESQLILSVDIIRKLGLIASVVAILLTVTYHFSVPARFTGSFGGILDSSMQLLLMKSSAGIARAVRVAGLCLLVMACLKGGHTQKTVGLLGVMMILLSFACMGHTAIHSQRWLVGFLLVFHLGVVMFWFGAFLPLYIVARDEMISQAGSLILKFSSIALWLVPMILIAGVLISVALLPTFWSLFTPYGRLILVKVCGFGALMGLAALNKWRFGPKILAGHASSLTALQRIVAVEWLLVAILLAFTSIMTTLFSPPEH